MKTEIIKSRINNIIKDITLETVRFEKAKD